MFSDADSCPYDKLNKLITHMQYASNHVFHTIKLSNKQRKRLRKPWMSLGILKSMDRRDLLFEKWLKPKDPTTRRAYNKCRNQVNRIIKAAQKQRDANLLENSQSDMKKFWKNLNKITKRKQKSDSSLPKELKLESGETIHDATAIANHMNTHFVEKGPRLASQLPPSTRDILESCGPRNPHKMEFNRIGTCEVIDIGLQPYLRKSCQQVQIIFLQFC